MLIIVKLQLTQPALLKRSHMLWTDQAWSEWTLFVRMSHQEDETRLSV